MRVQLLESCPITQPLDWWVERHSKIRAGDLIIREDESGSQHGQGTGETSVWDQVYKRSI